MRLAMIGLGRMGGNMSERLLRGGHEVVVFDRKPPTVQQYASLGAIATTTLSEVTTKLKPPRIVWIMVPAGKPVDEMIAAVLPGMSKGDVIIDGGNSNFHDTMRRAADLQMKGIHFVDSGTSGGIWGLANGYCLMIGASADAFKLCEPIFKTLAPPDGYAHMGPPGAGHYVKMVHNGIEYGLMAAYAEGFNVLRHANVGKQNQSADAETTPLRNPSHYQYEFSLADVAEVWRRGSVVASWLLDLTAIALGGKTDLSDFSGRVSDSGEGRWTVTAAIDEGAPVPVLSAALYQRFSSRGEADFADKLLSAMRFEFGGHKEVKPSSEATTVGRH